MRICFCLLVFLMIGKNAIMAQELSSFVEYGTSVHSGDHTPLWQVSNQQGLSSLDNNTYIRGGVSYKHELGKWKFEEWWIWQRQPGSLPPSSSNRLMWISVTNGLGSMQEAGKRVPPC